MGPDRSLVVSFQHARDGRGGLVIVALRVNSMDRAAGREASAACGSDPLSQVKEGTSTAADSLPPSKQADVPDSTTKASTTGTNADAPTYLAQGRKPQFKDAGLSQTGGSSRDLSAGSARSIGEG